MTYSYDNVSITDLGVTAVRIIRAIGVTPTGLNDSGNHTEVMFASPLTDTQKAALDAFMAGSNLDVIPTTTNSVWTVDNIEQVKTITGLDFDIYPTPNGVTFVFQKVLTNQDKTSLKNAFGSILKQVQ